LIETHIVIASAAKQSRMAVQLDCFAALAMTTGRVNITEPWSYNTAILIVAIVTAAIAFATLVLKIVEVSRKK
jgi:hypothetical protein